MEGVHRMNIENLCCLCGCKSNVFAVVSALAQEGEIEQALEAVYSVGDKPCCRTKAVFVIALAMREGEYFEYAKVFATYIGDDEEEVRKHFLRVIEEAQMAVA